MRKNALFFKPHAKSSKNMRFFPIPSLRRNLPAPTEVPAVKRRPGKQNCCFSTHNYFFHFSTLQIDAFGRKNNCFIAFSGALKIVTWDLQNKDRKNAKSSLQKVCHFSSHNSHSSHFRVRNRSFLFKTHLSYSFFRCVRNRHLGLLFWKPLIGKKRDFRNIIKTA